MIAEITLIAKKTYKIPYPDNDYSDEVIIDNFWLWAFDSDEFMDKSKLTLKRKIK